MKKYTFYTIVFQLLISNSLFAMGAKRPKQNPSANSDAAQNPNSPNQSSPAPSNPTLNTKPTTPMGPDLSADTYLDVASVVGSKVDQAKGMNELLKIREVLNVDQVDKCFDDNKDHNTFSEQISYYVQKMMTDVPSKMAYVGSYYGTSSNDANYFPVNLMRHPLCNVTAKTISTTLGGKSIDSTTINRINKFADNLNQLRQEAINGNEKSKAEIVHMWSTFYSCLAYTESLPTADSSKSKSVAVKYAASNYRKPSGVEFYEDPSQSAESRLNIGMFQFTPSSSNNIQPCLRAWNDLHISKPQCLINTKASQSELINVTGSSLQSFNAFCGVHKMLQTFSIQVNTTKSSATHPSNIVNGKFKDSEQRCVSPHFKAGYAYVHFGPFMNSTGSNTAELYNCIEKSL